MDSDETKAAILDRKIDELEQLLERAKEDRSSANVPILDDLVEYDEESVIKNNTDARQLQTPPVKPIDLSLMLEEVESKIADELDALVDILKDTIKDSVMTEIKNQLDKTQPLQTPDKNNE